MVCVCVCVWCPDCPPLPDTSQGADSSLWSFDRTWDCNQTILMILAGLPYGCYAILIHETVVNYPRFPRYTILTSHVTPPLLSPHLCYATLHTITSIHYTTTRQNATIHYISSSTLDCVTLTVPNTVLFHYETQKLLLKLLLCRSILYHKIHCNAH